MSGSTPKKRKAAVKALKKSSMSPKRKAKRIGHLRDKWASQAEHKARARANRQNHENQ